MSLINFTSENFESEALHSDKPVLIDFWASWCGPCRMVSPIVDEIAEEVTHAKVGKVNVDEQPELAQKYGITNIPTLIVLRDGKVSKTSVGMRAKQDILNMLN